MNPLAFMEMTYRNSTTVNRYLLLQYYSRSATGNLSRPHSRSKSFTATVSVWEFALLRIVYCDDRATVYIYRHKRHVVATVKSAPNFLLDALIEVWAHVRGNSYRFRLVVIHRNRNG